MKNLRLTKVGKIVFTILTIIFSLVVYYIASILGNTGSENNLVVALAGCCWLWLLFGQFVIYGFIWK